MSVTILEALENADHNLAGRPMAIQVEMAQSQVHNARILLEKGYSIYDKVEPLLEPYKCVEDVPDLLEEEPK